MPEPHLPIDPKSEHPAQPEDLLLDLHLNNMAPQDRALMETRFSGDESLRAKSERLGKMLQPLDHWQTTPPPTQLADKVLAFIRESQTVPAFTFVDTDPASRTWVPRFVPAREWIAAAACILLLFGLFAPGVAGVRDRAQRTLCASNLGSIFQATGMYQQASMGALPFAGCVPGSSWLNSTEPDRPVASNSRHMYLLVRLGQARPRDFLCPADRKASVKTNAPWCDLDDFPGARAISYDAINMAGERPLLRPTLPIAILGDSNPLFVGARFNEGVDPETTNSPAHRGRGQTVLTLDGSARWITTPYYGLKGDNLWTVNNLRRYRGTEIVTAEDDVQLVPGCPPGDTTAH